MRGNNGAGVHLFTLVATGRTGEDGTELGPAGCQEKALPPGGGRALNRVPGNVAMAPSLTELQEHLGNALGHTV